jgi:AcrR family transcriptional regulator
MVFLKGSDMSPKITEARKEARRSQIIQAACKCFAEKGFHGTTIEDICRQSGLSTGAVYSYFSGKDELIKVIGEAGRRNTRAAIDAMVANGPAPKQLADALSKALNFLSSSDGIENARLSIRMWGEGLHTPQIREMLALGLSAGLEPIEEIVRISKQLGRVNQELDTTSISRIWHALYMGLSVQVAVDPTVDLAACTEVMSSLFNGTFSSPENESA